LITQGISTLSLRAAQQVIWPGERLAARMAAHTVETEALERLAAAPRRLGPGRAASARCACRRPCGFPELLRLRNWPRHHGMEAFATERYNLIGGAGH